MIRRPNLTVVLLAAVVMLCGCIGGAPVSSGSGPHIARLEKELKQERERLAEVRRQIEALRAERTELMEKLEQAQRDLTGGKPAAFRFRPTKVGFGFLTAAVDWDGKPGDDGIQALVRIEDQTRGSIKRAGRFRLELFDLSRDKDQSIEKWTFTPEAAAKYWHGIASGYLFKLSFSAGTPKTKEVTLVVDVELSEGGTFHATRTLRIDR